MKEEISRVRTGQVTYAVRDTHIDDKEIHEGDIMGIGDHGILAVGKELNEITKETINLLTDEETEQVILYKAECEPEDVSLIVNYALIDKTKLDSGAIAESYREAGYSDVKQMKINGILCETCTVPEEEISLTSFIGGNDDRLYMVMLNTDDEGSLHYMDSILRSVKPAEK